MKIYLASESPRRKKLLKTQRIPFKTIPHSYKEELIDGISPRKLVRVHSEGKAKKAVTSRKTGTILSADTIVVFRERIFGKPKNKKDAIKTLLSFSGKSHYVYTGLTLLDIKTGKLMSGYEKTKVFIKKLSIVQIESYVHKINALDKAGAYGIQEEPSIVEKIEGSYSNVVGLPLELLDRMLKDFKKQCLTQK